MEIQRHPKGHLEINLDAETLDNQKQEIAGLEYVLRNWKEKDKDAASCSVSLRCQSKDAGELTPVVESMIEKLNNEKLGISVDLKTVESLTGKADADLAQKKSHLKDLITLAMVDGQFDAEEQKIIAEIGEKLGFSESQIDSIYNESVLIPHQIESVNPATKEEKMQQLTNLCRLILADGKVDDWEKVLIFPFAVRMGFEPKDVSKLLQEMLDSETQ